MWTHLITGSLLVGNQIAPCTNDITEEIMHSKLQRIFFFFLMFGSGFFKADCSYSSHKGSLFITIIAEKNFNFKNDLMF